LRDADGKSMCGLIASPELFAPVQTMIHGKDAMSAGAAVLVGAGHGCDSARPWEFDQTISNVLRRKVMSAGGAARTASARRVWGL
jgi:hypothetical protein